MKKSKKPITEQSGDESNQEKREREPFKIPGKHV
jgi:hypothetical protein